MSKHEVTAALAELMDKLESNSKPTLPESVQAKRLVAAFKLYRESVENFPFEIGQLVTPRKNTTVRGSGRPHIIVDINPNAQPLFEGDISSSQFGRRPQMRVMCVHNEDETLGIFWVEAHEFEPWVGNVAA